MKTRGFTLIELLAVIIILGVLATLITPRVTEMLKDAEKNTNMTSAQNLVKAATLKASNNEMTGNNENIKINYTTGENTNYLDYTGTRPKSGQLQIKSNGSIAMAVRFGNTCYLKKYNSDDILTIPYNSNTCGANADVFTNYTMPELAITGDGLYEAQGEPGRYIYKGSNPDNYIWLDEDANGVKVSSEIYRIISYEEDGTIKVIRDNSIGTRKWDSSTDRKTNKNTYCASSSDGCNAWGTQATTYNNNISLTDLNQNFYYKYYQNNKSIYLEDNSSFSGTVTENSSLNIFLNHLNENGNYWLGEEKLDKYIKEHSFPAGVIYYYSTSLASDAKTLEQEKEEQKAYTWNGKIGLMNITEYVEASLNPTCTDVYSNFYYNSNYYYDTDNDGKKEQTISGYDNWPCSNRAYNWMAKVITEWTLTPNSESNKSIWAINSAGRFSYNNANNDYGIRPTFYLKSSVKLGGNGTSSEPYYIMENEELEELEE